jgi:chemotaxis protein methyltransferase CheR
VPRSSVIAQEREFAFTDRDFRFLASIVNRHTGIVLGNHKRDMVYSRLARRLRALGLKDFKEYCDLVQNDRNDGEIGNLVNAMTTNLTHFFREPHHFSHLRDEVLAPLRDAQKGRLRIWSAACSSGMEPYSIAMTLRSAIPGIERWDARILATDIDTNMLNAGKEGKYPLSELEYIPPVCRTGVEKQGERIAMPQALKSLIAFKPLNLLHDWPMKGTFDAVFCRNVVIYFDKPTQKKLFARMADIIKPGGWLYIGHSENLSGICDSFEIAGRTIYRKIA